MTSTTSIRGRLGNQIFRNLAVSFISEKNDLYVDYANYDIINNKLGIKLFVGKKIWNNKIQLTDDNYYDILSQTGLKNDLYSNENYFQTEKISNMIYSHLQNDNIKQNIIDKNEFNVRYNNNDDLFVHIRLGDTAKLNPGINYYLDSISKIQFNTLYISTDEKNHLIIQQIINKYTNTKLLDYDEIQTIQFGSTCKNVILSHGTFSAIIGYLAYFSNIYYPEYGDMWHGDIFSIQGWNKIKWK